MSYFLDTVHTSAIALRSASSRQIYAAVVGTVQTSSEHQIVGHSGTHLQFYVNAGSAGQYQVDVNVQSEDGTEVQMYVGDESLAVQTGATPFGDPAYGVYGDAQLSYAAIGLTNQEFVSMPAQRVEAQLETALNGATFVAIFGMSFDDGGPNGKGIHETHFTGVKNQDGAIAVYLVPTAGGPPTRRWFFFKFDNQSV